MGSMGFAMSDSLKAELVTIFFLVIPIGFFLYGAIWFLVSGVRANISRSAKLWALAGFGMVLIAAALPLLSPHIFGFGSLYEIEETAYKISVGLCILSFVAASRVKGRAGAAIIIGGLVVALFWIGTMLQD